MKKVIVYIDGFNLYYGIKSLNKKHLKWLNLQQLAQGFVDNQSILVEVKYFTAIVSTNDIEKHKKQKHYLNVLEHCCNKLKIIKGHFLPKSVRCHNLM